MILMMEQLKVLMLGTTEGPDGGAAEDSDAEVAEDPYAGAAEGPPLLL